MIFKRGTDKRKGFTLLEVIIALAIFGFVVTGLLAFLPWAIEGKGNIKDFNTACVMSDAIHVELERMGFNAVEEATDPDGIGLSLVARRNGLHVRYEDETCDVPLDERYFLIRCLQFPAGNRLAHDPSNGWLALQVDVQWPYKVSGGETEDKYIEVASSLREHFTYPAAITR
ncbi:MAG: prepilin-type N-terminal cleavage/methylation domain-containing protein [Opitutales bacterium]